MAMAHIEFDRFFKDEARDFLRRAILTALDEDGPDFTSDALFSKTDILRATIVAKEDTLVAGLPIIPIVMECCRSNPEYTLNLRVGEGDAVKNGTTVAVITGDAPLVLKAERIILNFMTHLSGIANLTARYVGAVRSGCRGGKVPHVLDTRKTLPGLRHAEKYGVLIGGGRNHRFSLNDMLMLKDNHIDRAGGITGAVSALRDFHGESCPPIEVECRTLDDVREAVKCGVHRIMLDNMDLTLMEKALSLIPDGIESEISGGVTLETIADIARLGPDYISVGRLTHSAPSADFSMRVVCEDS